jgi:hypothetical protein
MEACGSAHYWARTFCSYGHEVRLIAPQFVKPFVKSNKNDAADAHRKGVELNFIITLGGEAPADRRGEIEFDPFSGGSARIL